MSTRDARLCSTLALLVLVLLLVRPVWVQAEPVLTLPESIAIALRNNAMVAAAQEGVRGAEELQQDARKAFFPKLNLSYEYIRLNEVPTFSIPAIPGYLPRSFEFPIGTQNNYTLALQATQPLFTGGALWANYRINKLGVDVARADETRVNRDLILNVKVAYFTILKAQRNLEVARQSVAQLQAHRDTAQSFYEVGLVPKTDLLYAEVQLANGEQMLVQADNGVEQAKASFNTVLGRNINTPVAVEDIMTLTPFTLSLEECLARAERERAEIKANDLRTQQARAALDQTRSAYFPTVSAIGSVERFGDEPDVHGSRFQDTESWTIAVQASWDFWEWGRTRNRVAHSRTRVNQAEDTLRDLKDQIALEVKNAYLLLREAEKHIAVAQKAVEFAEENYRISEERYREQLATSIDVLDGQTLLTKAKRDYNNSLGDYNIEWARLERAMGMP